MLSDQWWDAVTYPFGVSQTAIQPDLVAWRAARFCHDALVRWRVELGLQVLVHSPTHGGGGPEVLSLATPLCGRARRVFGDLPPGVVGFRAPAHPGTMSVVETSPGQLANAGPWVGTRKVMFEAAGFVGVRGPGHEHCFHRRAKDLSALMWTVALLVRTYGGRSWAAPLTWDQLAEWSVNGHTWSAAAPALGVDDPQDAVRVVPADGRAVAVYNPAGWAGAVLVNDGMMWTHGSSFDLGAQWRAGADAVDLAVEVAGRAGLPMEPMAPQW